MTPQQDRIVARLIALFRARGLRIIRASELRERTRPKTRKSTQPEFLERSAQLVDDARRMSPEDIRELMGVSEKIADLNLKYVYDLRTYDEMHSRPEELPPAASHVWLDVLADSPQAGPAMLEKLITDPKVANAELGGGKAAAGFRESYREFVSLRSAQHEYRKLFLSLADQEMLPALFHCTTGKDRTGWAAAAFLTLLGVPKETVMEDYLRSNEYIIPLYRKVIDGAVASGIEEEIPLSILGVRQEYLEAAFDEMEKKYGTIEKYFSEGLGIDAAGQKALRDRYLGQE
jgi:protein-tyrosine phosphatase